MREKLIELIKTGISECWRPVEGCAEIIVEDFADYLIGKGVNICIDGEYLPREATIKGVLEQMQASSHPKCMEEFLRNLNGVTLATDNNVGGKWIPVEERLPNSELITGRVNDGNEA